MSESIMQYDMPNAAVTAGYIATEKRFDDMVKKLDEQRQEIRNKSAKITNQRRALVASDLSEAILKSRGWHVGKTFMLDGRSVPLTRVVTSCEMDYEECTDENWLALPESVRPGFKSGGYRCSYRNSYRLNAKLALGSRTLDLEHILMWQDNCEVFRRVDTSGGKIPLPCDYPAGSHYPLRENIVRSLQSAKVKLSEDSREYSIEWGYCSQVNGNRGIGLVPVAWLSITMNSRQCKELRTVANHQNQYQKLLAVFEKKGWIKSHRYDIETWPEGSPNAGEVRSREMFFEFNVIEPKEASYE